jgi:hypothetical protein
MEPRIIGEREGQKRLVALNELPQRKIQESIYEGEKKMISEYELDKRVYHTQ